MAGERWNKVEQGKRWDGVVETIGIEGVWGTKWDRQESTGTELRRQLGQELWENNLHRQGRIRTGRAVMQLEHRGFTLLLTENGVDCCFLKSNNSRCMSTKHALLKTRVIHNCHLLSENELFFAHSELYASIPLLFVSWQI